MLSEEITLVFQETHFFSDSKWGADKDVRAKYAHANCPNKSTQTKTGKLPRIYPIKNAEG